jgi:LacI family transcriptional regulator
MNGTVTIKDVAQRAGVSTATVSRVLNNVGNVEQDKLERVEAAIGELKYRRNLVARGLRTQRSHILSLLCSDIENPFFTSICRGIEDVASREGFAVLICNTDGDIAKEKEYIEMLAAQSVSGVIISPTSSSSTDIGSLLRQGIAVVAVDRRLKSETDSVFVDNRLGAYEATKHLIESGARRVACITGPRAAMTAQDRLVGYKDALADMGMRSQPSLIRYADFKDEGGYAATVELMSRETRPDALFVANNRMTTGALLALNDLGVRVPDEVTLVGFDDLAWANLVNPTISSVKQPTYELGREAAGLLLDRINGVADAGRRNLVLKPELMIRGSSTRGDAG